MEYDLELKIESKISENTEFSQKLASIIYNNKRVLLFANPGTGKTTFFVKLGTLLKRKNSSSKIIFVMPLLIIQDQTEVKFLNDYNIKVDLKINADKATITEDEYSKSTIILSTLQGIEKIKEYIKLDDLVVIDEAHTLLNSFRDSYTKELTYFNRPIHNLLWTKANLVLMTGTPLGSLDAIFDLYKIKISKNPDNIKNAKIKLLLAENTNAINIAASFVEYIKKKENKKLNCIYIKSKSNCEKINEYIISKGYNSKILTSDEKESKVYISIKDLEIIPENIDFLVSTNVISTGTNIHNENVGTCLMINEYNPVEIKQFSKRFRKKLDLDVLVINSRDIRSNNPKEYKILVNERNECRAYYKQIFNISKDFYNKNYNFKTSSGIINLSPKKVNEDIILDFVASETYCMDLLSKKTSLSNLNDILNQYDDIEATFKQQHIENIDEKTIKKLNAEFKHKKKALLLDFIENIDEYISAIYKNIETTYNTYLAMELFNSKPYKAINNIRQSTLDAISTPQFSNQILMPILDIYNHTSDIEISCIIFYELSQKTIPALKSTIIFNQQIYSAFQIDIDTNTAVKSISLKPNKLSNTIHRAFDDECKKILFWVFNYIINKDYFYAKDLIDYVSEQEDIIPILSNLSKRKFPLNLLSIDQTTNTYKISTALILLFAKSLFLIDQEQKNRRIEIDGKLTTKKCYVFSNGNKLKEEYPLNYLEYEISDFSLTGLKNNFKKSMIKVLSNKDLIIENFLNN